MDNSDKSFALITGATSGIGLATAEYFIAKGWSVVAVGRSASKLESLKKKYSSKVVTQVCDITNSEQVDQLIKNLIALKLAQKIKALVNNAGIWKRIGFFESDDDLWRNQFETNVLGSVRLTRELLKQAIAQNVQMSVINISSTLGLKPVANTAAYSAAKAAVVSWTQTLALEVAEHKIRVNCICPGIVDTPIHEKTALENLQNAQPLGRLGKPEDIAAGVYYLCSSEAEWITGAVLNIDGGISLL